MARASGIDGGRVETCGCGCGSMTVGDSEAHNSCGCGCGSQHLVPKTPEEEVAELKSLRDSIDRRLKKLAAKS